jgi:hypothetical protein
MKPMLLALTLCLFGCIACDRDEAEETDAGIIIQLDSGCPDTYHRFGSDDAAVCLPDMVCTTTDAGEPLCT